MKVFENSKPTLFSWITAVLPLSRKLITGIATLFGYSSRKNKTAGTQQLIEGASAAQLSGQVPVPVEIKSEAPRRGLLLF